MSGQGAGELTLQTVLTWIEGMGTPLSEGIQWQSESSSWRSPERERHIFDYPPVLNNCVTLGRFTDGRYGCLQGPLRRFRFRSKWDTCRNRDHRRRRGGVDRAFHGCSVNIKQQEAIDRILRRAQLTHQDFREVRMLRNEAFDYLQALLLKAPARRTIVNGLKLLIDLAGQAAQDSSGPRLPEVFDVASRFVTHAELDVRSTAARMIVGSLVMLKGLGRGPDAVGGVARALDVVRSFLSAELRPVERELPEKF